VRWLRILACSILLTSPAALAEAGAAAPPKPLGVFELASPETAPAFGFSYVPDWHSPEHYARLAAYSARTGHLWVVCFCSLDVLTEAGVRASVAKLAPIAPWVVGATWWEEHYEAALAPIPWQDDARVSEAIAHALEAAERSHAVIAAEVGWPIVWITGLANDDPRFGPWWYRPIPSGVSVVALDAFPSAFCPEFEACVAPTIRYVLETSLVPVALVWATFDGPEWPRPTAETLAGYGRWAQHPKVIANWLFTWDSRPGMTGLADMPDLHGAVLGALR
jgi:hypothetical protein